ncbi:MAG: sigma-70 family RNA polymerase sigma factor [Ruminococcus flavefaciens]|nr:sigma-70 family RNA polymerase sigma factor [Ruminococcus flavefaciens]
MTLEERNQKVMENAPLVTSIVKKMYLSPYAFFDKEDMFQQGIIGLIKAVERFDPDRGFAFSTYAVPMIQGEIMRFQREYAQTLKYARSDIDAFRRISRLGKDIDDLIQEDLEELEITPKNLAAIRSMNTTSINTPISDDGQTEFGDFISDSRNTSEFSEEFEMEIIENIKDLVIGRMTEKYQDMIDEWYYSAIIGMKARQPYLARKYGTSQAQVSRIIRKFKEAFAKKLVDSGYSVPDYIADEDD